MNWISVKDQQPTKRDCDKDDRSGFSIPIIVSDGVKVWDDVRCCFDYDPIKEVVKESYWVHRFGYDNDCFELNNIKYWMPLPPPPPTL